MLSLLFKDIDEPATVRKVDEFFKNDLTRLLLMSGEGLTDLSSPIMSGMPSGSRNDHRAEDSIIRGINAGAEINAVEDTIRHLPGTSEIIVVRLILQHKSWLDVMDLLHVSKHKLGELRREALIEFADGFDYWQDKHNCEPKVDLHAYKDGTQRVLSGY